jgi:hypothetical protein
MMLASPRLETGVRAFFDDMFGFDDFNNLAKDPRSIRPSPAHRGRTRASRPCARCRPPDHQEGDYRDLFTTRDTFMSPALAALYGLPAPPGWTPYEFPADSPRAGILTQISFLAVHSHPAAARRRCAARRCANCCCASRCRRRRPMWISRRSRIPNPHQDGARARRLPPEATRCARAATRSPTRWAWRSRISTAPASTATREGRADRRQRFARRQGLQGRRRPRQGAARPSGAAVLPGQARLQLRHRGPISPPTIRAARLLQRPLSRRRLPRARPAAPIA